MARKKQPDLLRVSEFEKRIARAEPAPVYVLVGADPYLLDKGRTAVRRHVLAEGDPGMALWEVEGAQAALADVLDSLRTLPFLAPRRLVLLREADKFVSDHRGALERYLDAPSPTGSLCLEVGSWNTGTKLHKAADKLGFVVRCEAVDPAGIPAWLVAETKRLYAKKLDFGAARMLVEYLGADMAGLVSALDRLDLYTGDRTEVGEADVDAVVARGQHERVWALTDAVAEGRLPRALELLDAFWAEGMVGPQVIGLLRTGLRQILLVKALSRRMSVDQALREARAPYGAFDRLRAAVRRFSDEHLADAYQAMVDADFASKTGADDRLAMETLLHRLCNPEAARAAGGAGLAL